MSFQTLETIVTSKIIKILWCKKTPFKRPTDEVRLHAQITTTKVVTLGLSNLSVSVPPNGERTQAGSFAHPIHGRSYWSSGW